MTENTSSEPIFFNDSVGILTGYLHDEDYNDHLYRTTDGGQSWQRQPIAKGKWIDAATVLPSEYGWLASSDQVMYRTTDAGAYPTYGKDFPLEDIAFGGVTGPVSWGHIGRDLYLKILPDGRWYRHFRFSDTLEALQPVDAQTTKIRTASGNYLFNRANMSLRPFRLRDSLPGFKVADLIEVKFTEESKGCFHFNQEEKVYRRKGGAFKAKGGRGVLADTTLRRLLEVLLDDPASNQLADLPLHPAAKSTFLHDVTQAITAKTKARKYDRPRLTRLQNPELLQKYVDLPEKQLLEDAFFLARRGELGWSTTTNTESITLSFRSGPPLILTHEHSYAVPNYLRWRLDSGKDQFYYYSGWLRDFYLDQRLNDGARLDADTALPLQLGAVWLRNQARKP